MGTGSYLWRLSDLEFLATPTPKPLSGFLFSDHSHEEISTPGSGFPSLLQSHTKGSTSLLREGILLFLLLDRQKEWGMDADFWPVVTEYMDLKTYSSWSLAPIIPSLEEGVQFTALDTKDASFLIDIHLSHMRFLFSQGHYQFRVLPLGLATVPRVFTEVFFSSGSLEEEKWEGCESQSWWLASGKQLLWWSLAGNLIPTPSAAFPRCLHQPREMHSDLFMRSTNFIGPTLDSTHSKSISTFGGSRVFL